MSKPLKPLAIVLAVLLAAATAWTVGRAHSPGGLLGEACPPEMFSGVPASGIRHLGPPYPRQPATGPLRACPENPRYFCNPAGEAVYLTGAHNWQSLKDRGESDPPPVFDFDNYLDFLVLHNHNFIRLWTWELPKSEVDYSAPAPWLRSGPGLALDGKPRFDLSRFNQAYFDRLRSRIIAAGERDIYVSVMLFEGWALQRRQWQGHPFHPQNNIQGIDGDINHDGRGTEVHTLRGPAVTRIQEAYVRKVVDTVNDLDNVLYEIANEAGPYSTAWQYHMIRYVKALEATRLKQHPVGMTFQWKDGTNAALFSSPADWVSPGPEPSPSYMTDPPSLSHHKVILTDTDHLWGIGGDPVWVWKSFTRGLNPLYMDDLQPIPAREAVRLALGHTRAYASRLNLLRMLPRGDLASSGYCLADPGSAYLAFLPAGGTVALRLCGTSADFAVEWFDPQTAEIHDAGSVRGGHLESFRAPFAGPAVLYLESTRLSSRQP
jgi:hypothetical protein